MRRLILSDLHLEHGGTKAPALLDDLARLGSTFDQVVFNGDTYDYLRTPEDAERLKDDVRRMREKFSARKSAPVFLTGNHDPVISNEHWLYLEEPQLLITHGDLSAEMATPWSEEGPTVAPNYYKDVKENGPHDFGQRVQRLREIQIEFWKTWERDKPQSAGYYLLKQFFNPLKPFMILYYMSIAPGQVARWSKSFPKPVRTIAFGHSHRAGHWVRESCQVYNTGSYMPGSYPVAVIVEGTRLEHVPVKRLLEGLRVSVAVSA
jgi:UDP-2,3-diacylglucosamine pyrophosphatase LpxH